MVQIDPNKTNPGINQNMSPDQPKLFQKDANEYVTRKLKDIPPAPLPRRQAEEQPTARLMRPEMDPEMGAVLRLVLGGRADQSS